MIDRLGMDERRGSSPVWGIRRAKTLSAKVSEVAGAIEELATKVEPFTKTGSPLERDPQDVTRAFDTLRAQHEELRAVNAQLRAQLDELRKMEEIVVFERARADATFLRAPDAYVITDADGIIREANLSAVHLLDVPERLLVGKPLESFVDRTESERARTMTATAYSGKIVDALLRFRKHGTTQAIPTATIVAPIETDGALFLATTRDSSC